MEKAKVNFWNHKILGWEKSRYESRYFPKKDLLARMEYAQKLIHSKAIELPYVVDLGCGTGILFRGLDVGLFKKLMGVDFSSKAIEVAKQAETEKLQFRCEDVIEAHIEPGFLVVGLGLLDWLSDEEILQLFKNIRKNKFLLSYSRQNAGLRQKTHQMFIQGRSLFRDSRFTPKYYSEENLLKMLSDAGHSCKNLVFHKSKNLGLCGFVSNLGELP